MDEDSQEKYLVELKSLLLCRTGLRGTHGKVSKGFHDELLGRGGEQAMTATMILTSQCFCLWRILSP